ncbi:MAG: lysylphosphatidylglycerol synthase transmembrane domain-containing protein [Candidatus Scalinduaceae bacterium]
MKLNKKKIVFVSGILISIICSWLFVKDIEWSGLNKAFAEANYIYVLPAILITFLSHFIRAVRWSGLIAPIKRTFLLNLFSATMIGLMVNCILPARMGEIIKPIIIGRKENIKFTTSFATVVIERILDLLCIIVFASLILLIFPSETSHKKNGIVTNYPESSKEELIAKGLKHSSGVHSSSINGVRNEDLSTLKQLKNWSAIFAFIGILAITLLFLLSIYPEKTATVVERLIFFLPHNLKDKSINLLGSFVSGLQIFDNKKQLIWIGFLSLIIWLLNASVVYVLAYSFNIRLPFVGACFVIVCLALAIALPQAPGFIGVFHVATQKSLDIFGAGVSSAQSYAIIFWTITIIPTALVGFLFLWKEGMSLKEVAKQDIKVPK